MTISYSAEKLRKSYIRKTIFSDISFSLVQGQSLTVTGRNGSGKSTLLKVLAQIHGATSGKVIMQKNGKVVADADVFQQIGFVSPYLQVYEEFTAWENLDMLRHVRNIEAGDDLLNALLERVQLHPRRHDVAKTFSSGMKQRLKYACALLHAPPVLMLDEPTANLDLVGRSLVESIVKEQQEGGIVIIATNEPQEIAWCQQTIDLDARRAS